MFYSVTNLWIAWKNWKETEYLKLEALQLENDSIPNSKCAQEINVNARKKIAAEGGKLLNTFSRLDMCLLVVQRKSVFIWLSYGVCTHTDFILMRRSRPYLFTRRWNLSWWLPSNLSTWRKEEGRRKAGMALPFLQQVWTPPRARTAPGAQLGRAADSLSSAMCSPELNIQTGKTIKWCSSVRAAVTIYILISTLNPLEV